MHLYFAYGSNMLPDRLSRRVGDLRCLGKASLSAYGLSFSKIGQDGSGKCTLLPDADDVTHGVVYQVDEKQLSVLSSIEGPGYQLRSASVTVAGNSETCQFYQAIAGSTDASLKPFSWYLALVVGGARIARLPRHYVEQLLRIQSIVDPDGERHRLNMGLLGASR